MIPYNFEVSLTHEFAELLKERGYSAYIHKGHILQCESYAEEGSFLHLQVCFPFGTKLRYLDGRDVEKEIVQSVRWALSIPVQTVAYIVSIAKEKHPGFLGEIQATDKGEAESH